MILLFGGTQEGRETAMKLKDTGLDVIVSVVSQQGVDLLDKQGIKSICGRLDEKQIEDSIDDLGVNCIVDTTHPFAVIVSRNLIEVSKKKKIPLIRIERKHYEIPDNPLISRVENIQKAAVLAGKLGKNIFLTIGSQGAFDFTSALREKKHLVTRVLPSESSIKATLKAGFQRENIITGIGPFGVKENLEDFAKYNIDVIVSKESGRTGGLPEKIEAALRLGINIVLIKRPLDPYENCDLKDIRIIDFKDIDNIAINELARQCG